MGKTAIIEKDIQQAHCDWVKAQAKELKALLSYDDNVIAMNKTRAISTIDSAMDALRELKNFIEGK